MQQATSADGIFRCIFDGASRVGTNKATSQPAFNLGPLLAGQRNAIQIALHWRADSGPILRAYWDVCQVETQINIDTHLV